MKLLTLTNIAGEGFVINANAIRSIEQRWMIIDGKATARPFEHICSVITLEGGKQFTAMENYRDIVRMMHPFWSRWLYSG